MTRPTEYEDRATTTLRLPRDLLARIDAECHDRLLGRNKLIELLLRAALDRLPPPEVTREAPVAVMREMVDTARSATLPPLPDGALAAWLEATRDDR